MAKSEECSGGNKNGKVVCHACLKQWQTTNLQFVMSVSWACLGVRRPLVVVGGVWFISA